MRIRNFFLVYYWITFFILSVLLFGCATTETIKKTNEEVGSSVTNEVPKDVRINEFILGPGDKVDIVIHRHDNLKRTIQIDTSGKLFYPLVGDIQAGGLGVFQLRDRIRDGLSKYIIDPQVSIGVSAVQSHKFIVLGEVNNPGLFNFDVPLTALEAVSKAGGFTSASKRSNVFLIREGFKKPDLVSLNLDKLLKGEDLTQNVYLHSGDIIYVPATTIVNVGRFFNQLSNVLSPFLTSGATYILWKQIVDSSSSGSLAIPTK